MKRSALVVFALVSTASLGACGSGQDAHSEALDPAVTGPSDSMPPSLPKDPPQSAEPGTIMYAANETVDIDHTGKYEWHSPPLAASAGTPGGSILFEYRFNGDVETSKENATPERLPSGETDMVFTFNVDSYTGTPVLQIIKAAAAISSGGPSQ